MAELGETIRRHRVELGLSQTALAKACGVKVRQIGRYETGEQQPTLGVAVMLASALGISVSELAGESAPTPRLSGDWWAAWQTYIRGEEMVTTQPVQIAQTGTSMQIKALALATVPVAGDYLWRGELRLWEGSTLMGWYVATDENVRSKGTMFFVLHTQGTHAEGRWVGTSYDGPVVTGWAALSRTEDELRGLIAARADAPPQVGGT